MHGAAVDTVVPLVLLGLLCLVVVLWLIVVCLRCDADVCRDVMNDFFHNLTRFVCIEPISTSDGVHIA